jgi:hypothetical protein
MTDNLRKTMEEVPETEEVLDSGETIKLEEELTLFEFYKFRAEYGLYNRHFFGLEFDEIMEEYGDKITMQYHHDYYDKTVKEVEEFCKLKFGIDLFDKNY